MKKLSRKNVLTIAVLLVLPSSNTLGGPAAPSSFGPDAAAASHPAKKARGSRWERFQAAWEKANPKQRKRYTEKFEKLRRMDAPRREKILESMERWRKLKPEQRRQFIEQRKRWKAMSQEKQQRVRERMRRLGRMDRERQMLIRYVTEELLAMGPKTLQRLRKMTPEQRKPHLMKALERARSRMKSQTRRGQGGPGFRPRGREGFRGPSPGKGSKGQSPHDPRFRSRGREGFRGALPSGEGGSRRMRPRKPGEKERRPASRPRGGKKPEKKCPLKPDDDLDKNPV